MAIKSPAELKKEAAPLIAQRNEAEQKLQEKRAAATAQSRAESERHVAEAAKAIEDSVESLVTLAISYNVKHVIIGKFDYRGETYGRFDWAADEDELIFSVLQRKLQPAGYKLKPAAVASFRLQEGKERVFPVTLQQGRGREAHGTHERWLMPAKLIATKSVQQDGNNGCYLVLYWDD